MTVNVGKRKPFLPSVVRAGETVDSVNAHFQAQAAALGLQFRCPECLYVNPVNGKCLLRFPNGDLMREPAAGLDDHGAPLFCKSFEV
jgi:hypothetical protein